MQINALTHATRQPGSYDFGPYDISAYSGAEFTIRVNRDGWPDTGSNVIDIKTYLSLDNGDTWQFYCGFTAKGGNTLHPVTGEPHNTSGMRGRLPDSPAISVKGTLTVYTRIKVSADIIVV